jgi:endonuclease-3
MAPASTRKADKAARICAVLDELHPDPPIPLVHLDPFTLLVAVVLSAQSTDKKVNELTPALFAEAPTPAAMAAMPVERILALIRQLGLAPQKARALAGLSRHLTERHGGLVPSSMEDLTALPGVGRKTANVVRVQAFGIPAFPVDTHIHRLAHRWGLSRASSPDGVEADLTRVFPEARWARLHLQIIHFGRAHCPALHHDLERCPICAWAATRKRIDEERARNEALRRRPGAARAAGKERR